MENKRTFHENDKATCFQFSPKSREESRKVTERRALKIPDVVDKCERN